MRPPIRFLPKYAAARIVSDLPGACSITISDIAERKAGTSEKRLEAGQRKPKFNPMRPWSEGGSPPAAPAGTGAPERAIFLHHTRTGHPWRPGTRECPPP